MNKQPKDFDYELNDQEFNIARMYRDHIVITCNRHIDKSLPEVAKLLGINDRTLYRYFSEFLILRPSTRTGGKFTYVDFNPTKNNS